ncbi:hypothetical protein CW667_03505 [Candidatus Bathyarchaeota archaeon]|nr:MAG: hypothetical protein CW667_03505 [Candidatus Bathyarchaeota archaeon]
MVLPQPRLIHLVKHLFNEDDKISRMIVELLQAGKPRINFDEILSTARSIEKENAKNLAMETCLVMEYWKLMLPVRTKHDGSIQWSNRLNRPESREEYEIPGCITFAFEHLKSEGVWDWRSAVKDYLDKIKESNQRIIIDITEDIVRNAYLKRFVNKLILQEACGQHNYLGNVDTLIVELKGGGIISPCVEYSLFSRKSFEKLIKGFSKTGPFYELNRALFVLELKGCEGENSKSHA